MRLLTVSMALGLLLATGDAVRPQTAEIQAKVEEKLAKERAKSLEDLLAKALKDNPDIRVAESKLREAEAELNRVRLLVTQKLVAQQRDIALQKATMQDAELTYRRLQQLQSSGTVSMEALKNAQLTLEKVKADLARLEADLPYLLGSSPLPKSVLSGAADLAKVIGEELLSRGQTEALRALGRAPEGKKPIQGQYSHELYLSALAEQWQPIRSRLPEGMADKLRKALDAPVNVDFKEASPEDVLDFLQRYAKGFNLVPQVRLEKSTPVSLRLSEPVPMGAVFQFLEDQYGWRFVVREYGIVVAEPGRVPPGAVHLQDFWKNRPTQGSTTTSTSSGSSTTSSSTPGKQK